MKSFKAKKCQAGRLLALAAVAALAIQMTTPQAQAQDAAARQYIQSAVASTPSTSDELAKLAALKADGTLSEAEFNAAKAKLLGA